MLNVYRYYDKPKELPSIPGVEERDGGLVIGVFNNKEIILSSRKVATRLNWEDAKEYCTKLNYNAYNDWRLPNKEELDFIYRNNNKVFQYPEYQIAAHDNYWSSTDINGKYVWVQNLTTGMQTDYTKDKFIFYVRAIRTQKV